MIKIGDRVRCLREIKLFSTSEVPDEVVPVGTLGVGAWGARNAAFLALRILSLSDTALERSLEERARAQARPPRKG